jgi:copper chaperone
LTETTVSVLDISCETCKQTIEAALRQMPGVELVYVDVAAKTVAVTFEAPATRAEVVSRIESRGFEVARQ